MNDPFEGHAGWFRDVRRIIDVTESTPGLPLPRIFPAQASFDYRHIVHAEIAREAVTCARAALEEAFGVTFSASTETDRDGISREKLEALLPSGLTLVIISRVSLGDDLDAAERRPELAVA